MEKKKKNDLKRQPYVGYVKKNSMIQLMKMVIKRMGKLETIVIIQEDTGEPHITRVTLSIENLHLYLWCFITLVVMIATYLLKTLDIHQVILIV